jgi:MFS family permease
MKILNLSHLSDTLKVSDNFAQLLKPDNPMRPPNPWKTVFWLTLAYVFSFIDRYILNLLAPQLKADLQLSDLEISLLIGPAFAVFYALMSIPLGLRVDMQSRKTLIVWGLSLWSLMTALSGLTRNYSQLLMARMGVGIGEATLSPASYSLLSDIFPKERLATAIGVYSMGVYFGSGLAYMLGGQLIGELKTWENISLPFFGSIYGWQLVFFIVGLPGLLLAFFIRQIHEPLRDRSKSLSFSVFWSQFSKGFTVIRQKKAFWWMCLGSGFFFVNSYAAAVWLPSFLMRIHRLDIGEVGIGLGIGMFIAPVGLFAGSRWADHWTKKGIPSAKIRLCALVSMAWLPFSLLYLWPQELLYTWLFLIPFMLLSGASIGAGAAAVQEMMPSEIRGLASAIFLFSQNIMGLVLGPTAVAFFTERLFANPQSIHFSMMIVALIALPLSVLFFAIAVRKNQ